MDNCKTKCLSQQFSDCLIYSGESIENTCFTICKGTDFSSILNTLTDFICSNDNTCKVKVSENDECCDYLANKLTSDDDSIIFTTSIDEENNCAILDLKVQATVPEWINIEFEDNFDNYAVGSTQAQYFVEPGSGKVTVRGRIQGTNFPSDTLITTSLPNPDLTERFSFTINNSGNLYPIEALLIAGIGLDLNLDTTDWTGDTGSLDINFTYYITV